MALHILIGEKTDEIKRIDDSFDLQYKDSWFQDKLVQAIIDDICCLYEVNGRILTIGIPFDRNEKQVITPELLPTGIKALIMLLFKEVPYLRGSLMGNNCSKWLQKIAEFKEIYVTMNYIMHFEKYPIHVLNNNSYPNNEWDMALLYDRYMHKLYDENLKEIYDYRKDIPRKRFE